MQFLSRLLESVEHHHVPTGRVEIETFKLVVSQVSSVSPAILRLFFWQIF